MGQVLLCHPYKANIPYILKRTGARIFTYEELCFFICENLDLIDRSFMDHDLNEWLSDQLSMNELGETLDTLMRNGCEIEKYIIAILQLGGYLGENDIARVREQLLSIGAMSKEQRLKHQGDKYLKNKKFATALNYYERLLKELMSFKNADKPADETIGDIYHNIGVAYANMFLFKRAARFFEKAYEKNGREVSLEAADRARDYLKRDYREFSSSGRELARESGEADAILEFDEIKRKAMGMCEHGVI